MITTAKIYFLEHPETKQPFYVGCTTKTLKQRLCGHMSSPYVAVICKEKLAPTIELIEEVPIEVAAKMEAYWIDQFKAWGFELQNQEKAGKLGGVYNPISYNSGRYQIISPISADAAIKKFKTNMSELENLLIAGTIKRFKDFYTSDPVLCRKELKEHFSRSPNPALNKPK